MRIKNALKIARFFMAELQAKKCAIRGDVIAQIKTLNKMKDSTSLISVSMVILLTSTCYHHMSE